MDTSIVVDAKGRPDPDDMTLDEKLSEILISQRNISDLIEGVMAQMRSNPMMRAFLK